MNIKDACDLTQLWLGAKRPSVKTILQIRHKFMGLSAQHTYKRILYQILTYKEV